MKVILLKVKVVKKMDRKILSIVLTASSIIIANGYWFFGFPWW